jgi:hypothetical protein
MMLIILLSTIALLMPSWGSALVVYFTLFSYFYIIDEDSLRTPKFLRRTPRNTS